MLQPNPDMRTNPNVLELAQRIINSNAELLEGVNRPLQRSQNNEMAEEESRFDYLELSQEQMYKNLQDLQDQNKKSIEKHLLVKA